MYIWGAILHMLSLFGFLSVVKNVECNAVETQKTLELLSEIKTVCLLFTFLKCPIFQVFWTEFLPIIVFWEESNKSFLCFNFFVLFWIHIKVTFTVHCFFDAVNMLVAYLWNVTKLWLIWCCLRWVCVTAAGVCPLRPPPFSCTSLISSRRKRYFGLSVSSAQPRRHYSCSPRFPYSDATVR